MEHFNQEKIKKALEAAHHELTTLHGLILADGAAPNETWISDTNSTVSLIQEAINQLAHNESLVS